MDNKHETPLELILTCTTGRLFVPITDVYPFVSRVCGWDVFTHHLGRVMDEQVGPWIFKCYPEIGSDNVKQACDVFGDELRKVPDDQIQEAITKFVIGLCVHAGLKPAYDIPAMPLDDRSPRDPIEELVAMVGPGKVVTISDTGVEAY